MNRDSTWKLPVELKSTDHLMNTIIMYRLHFNCQGHNKPLLTVNTWRAEMPSLSRNTVTEQKYRHWAEIPSPWPEWSKQSKKNHSLLISKSTTGVWYQATNTKKECSLLHYYTLPSPTHTHTHSLVHTYIHVYIHTHQMTKSTYATYIHAHIHTFIHTWVCQLNGGSTINYTCGPGFLIKQRIVTNIKLHDKEHTCTQVYTVYVQYIYPLYISGIH